MRKRVKVPISAARTRLFQLADLVRTSDDAVVVLEQRGRSEPVALVREARLAYLESRVSRMEEKTAPFALAGSVTTAVDDRSLEQALRTIRGEWSSRRRQDDGPAARRTRRRAR